jgi:hypothetical protein
LGDYAKGDGSDETEAIQCAINAIPTAYSEHLGAELFIPRPPRFYGISRTLLIEEKWNCTMRCATPAVMERATDIGHNHYFHWLGGNDAVMFRVNGCKGLHLINLSLNGRDAHFNRDGYVGTSQGVVGLAFGPLPGRSAGFATDIVVDSLSIANVHDGVLLGQYADNGPDVRAICFYHPVISDFAHCAIVMESGNLAAITLIGPTLSSHRTDGQNATACVEGRGGELLSINHCTSGACDADIYLHTGGVQVVKAWSEVAGAFLRTASVAVDLQSSAPYGGAISYPVLLEGCRHYSGAAQFSKSVVDSIVYDLPVSLNLVACTLFRGVHLGETSGACILDHGTVFIDGRAGFYGPGVTRHHRLVSVGARATGAARILEPYVVDRRSVPGTEPPKTGVWQRGDGVVNLEPDPSIPAKACRGWTCVAGGEPGTWFAYGALVTR